LQGGSAATLTTGGETVSRRLAGVGLKRPSRLGLCSGLDGEREEAMTNSPRGATQGLGEPSKAHGGDQRRWFDGEHYCARGSEIEGRKGPVRVLTTV